MFKVAVLVGSTRPNSTNMKFARALEKLAAGRMTFDYVEIADLPFYDDSLWQNPPASVQRLKAQIAAADAVLFVTPEYNRSIPGVLKNAIDWPSRPYGLSVWSGKPGAIVGATPGPLGTAAAQAHLRSVAVVLGIAVMGTPEIYFQMKPDLIDDEARVVDERTRLFLEVWVQRFEAWVGRFAEPHSNLIAAE